MKHYSSLRIFLLIFIMAGFLSCERVEQPTEPELPPQREITIPFEQELPLTQFFPELESNPSIKNAHGKYYIALGTQTWNENFKVGEVFIPAQTCEPVLLRADKVIYRDEPWWRLSTSGVFVINQQIPEEFETIAGANCKSKFRLHIALDETSPYNSVTLSWFTIEFNFAMRAKLAQGSEIPTITLTKEGTDIDFNLNFVSGENHFKGQDGKLYFTAEPKFSATITSTVKDSPDLAPDFIRIICTLEMERIDFEQCDLSYSSIIFPEKEVRCEPFPLPSFLSGIGSDLYFNGAEIFIHYQNTIPSSLLKMSFPDVRNNPSFQLSYPDNYALIPKHDGWDRPGYEEKAFSALEEIFRVPAKDRTLTPRMIARACMNESKRMQVTPGQEYGMSLDAEWRLPLAFAGEMTGISMRTETIYMDGDQLDAPGNGTHSIGITLRSRLPFDCIATPVFTVEGDDPVSLDNFIVEGYKLPWFEYTFTPGKDHWKASLYFIITPSAIISTPFGSDQSLILNTAYFTANLKKD